MLVTELGMVTEVRPLHHWKASFPMLVTELGMGMVTLLKSRTRNRAHQKYIKIVKY